MTANRHTPQTQVARTLRARQTKAEALMWSSLRNRRLCGLKFRRQCPFGSYVLDFACMETRLAVEIDGGYHDWFIDDDIRRQEVLGCNGWRLLRFTNDDVLERMESVLICIARTVEREPVFRGRVLG